MFGSVQGFCVPVCTFRLWHKAHEFFIAVLARLFPELLPSLLQGLATPAELEEQLALHLRQLVFRHGPVWLLLLECQSPVHPRKRFGGLPLLVKHLGQREAVLAPELGLLAESNVCADIVFLNGAVTQYRSPASAPLLGLTLLVETALHCAFERGKAMLVHDLCGIAADVV